MKMTLDYEKMKEIFNAPFEYFEPLGEVRLVRDRKHIFIPRGGNVLAVAHLDNVNEENHFYNVNIKGKDTILSTRCDDRVGVFILLEILPLFGINADVLLTDLEEVGQSTGSDFFSEKSYNWIFEFDRREDDAVLYSYESIDWKDTVSKFFKVGRGSASDISRMEHLNCKALNIGCGYTDEHDIMARLDIKMMKKQIGKFINFYQVNKDIHFPHAKFAATPILGANPRARWGGDYWDDEYWEAHNKSSTTSGSGSLEKCKYCTTKLAGSITGVCSLCTTYCRNCIFCKAITHLHLDSYWKSDGAICCQECSNKIKLIGFEQIIHCCNCFIEIPDKYMQINGFSWCDDCYNGNMRLPEGECPCEIDGSPMCGTDSCHHYTLENPEPCKYCVEGMFE